VPRNPFGKTIRNAAATSEEEEEQRNNKENFDYRTQVNLGKIIKKSSQKGTREE
jgi:hypothetical protein